MTCERIRPLSPQVSFPSGLRTRTQEQCFNLQALFGIKKIPCDTRMREILDEVAPSHLQRGKYLERFVYFQGHYLLTCDGTTHFSSQKIHCTHCLQKRSHNQVVTCYHQTPNLTLVHLDLREVVPLCSKPIIQQDGTDNGDGDAALRFGLGILLRRTSQTTSDRRPRCPQRGRPTSECSKATISASFWASNLFKSFRHLDETLLTFQAVPPPVPALNSS